MREVTVIIRLLITKVSIREDEVELFTNYQRECSRLYTSPAHSTVHTSILSWRLRFQSLKFLSGQLVSQKKKQKKIHVYTCGKSIFFVSTIKSIETGADAASIAIGISHKFGFNVFVERLNVSMWVEGAQHRGMQVTARFVTFVTMKAGGVRYFTARDLRYVRQCLAMPRPIRTIPMIT